MKVIFTGDINFRGHENLSYDKAKDILCEVIPYTKNADFVIPNLECPLGNEENYNPIKKDGPNLICKENNVCFLNAINAYAVTIANNHIGDYGSEALNNTIKILNENDIRYVGAGNNILEAYKAIRITKDDIKISVISVCENEFGMATETEAGSAGYNPRILMSTIKQEKKCSDFVIIVFHGGNEFNPLPSPATTERYRLICDMGADAIIGGHTHCPQGYEVYNNKPIVYSMGNFLFQRSSECAENDSWYYGYMSELDINKNGIHLNIIPYKFNKNATEIKIFKNEERKKMLEYIENLSNIIVDTNKLKDLFMGWAWNHKWCPCLPKDFNLSEYNVSGDYNQIKCEAHLAVVKQLFEILFNNDTEKAKEMEQEILKLQKMPV